MRIQPILPIVLSMAFSSACGTAASTDPQAPNRDPGTPAASAPASANERALSAEGKRLNAFFEEVFQRNVDRSPFTQAFLGIKKDQDKWGDFSEKRQREDLELAKGDLQRMRAEFKYDDLDRQSQISYRLFEYQVERQIAGFKWRDHNYPINQMFGLQSRLATFLINFHRIDNVVDARAYITRLSGVRSVFDEAITGIRRREKAGIMPPRFVFPMTIRDARNIISGRPFDDSDKDSTILADFRRKVTALKDVAQADKDALIADAAKALTTVILPVYTEIIALMEEQHKKATTDDGAWKLPGGEAFYNFQLESFTTTELTADEIHQIGLDEVARIHTEMRTIMKKVAFRGDLPAFFKHMRENARFYYSNDEAGRKAYLAEAERIIGAMKARLDELFITKPKADLIVKRVEAFREQSASKAFYNSPALDGSRPGMYYANMYNMRDMPTYQMEALAYHEAIPGHHMQNAIAQEQLKLPMFRRFSGYSAYGEGWGLYAEYIPKEMGFYSDPYSDFGRLAMELWRACRLVVDTGIHRKKWTRERAIEYLRASTPNPEGDVVKAIERYIVMPGQATAYKIGMLEILRLRERAREKLGDKFDIRQFHEVVLTSGPVPLTVLGELIDEWIAAVQ